MLHGCSPNCHENSTCTCGVWDNVEFLRYPGVCPVLYLLYTYYVGQDNAQYEILFGYQVPSLLSHLGLQPQLSLALIDCRTFPTAELSMVGSPHHWFDGLDLYFHQIGNGYILSIFCWISFFQRGKTLEDVPPLFLIYLYLLLCFSSFQNTFSDLRGSDIPP